LLWNDQIRQTSEILMNMPLSDPRNQLLQLNLLRLRLWHHTLMRSMIGIRMPLMYSLLSRFKVIKNWPRTLLSHILPNPSVSRETMARTLILNWLVKLILKTVPLILQQIKLSSNSRKSWKTLIGCLSNKAKDSHFLPLTHRFQ